MRVAFELSPNGMVITNATGTILDLNAEVERCFGYARGDLVGGPLKP